MHFRKNFIEKEKKKTNNVLTTFSIFHKSVIKTFLKWFINNCPKGYPLI